MYKLFLCLRYLRKRRIAFFAIAAVWLCTAMVLIVISVMGGFLDMVTLRSRGLLGDLIIANDSLQGFPFYQEFIDRIKTEMPDVIDEATPVIINYGLLRFVSSNVTKPVQVKGVRLHETYRVNDFHAGLFYDHYYPGTTTLGEQKMPAYGNVGSEAMLPTELENAYAQWRRTATEADKKEATKFAKNEYLERPGFFLPVTFLDPDQRAPGWFDDDLPGLIAGIDVCAERGEDGSYKRVYPRGDRVLLTLFPLTPSGSLVGAGTSAPTVAFRLVDDSRTDIYDIDSMSVYVDFDTLQEYLLMQHIPGDGQDRPDRPARATQVEIKLKPLHGTTPEAVRDRIQAMWTTFAAARMDQTSQPMLLELVHVDTWRERQAKYIAAVEKEKILVTILFGVISLVAVLLVGCIFYMIVQQKTRDIGIVKSVGATFSGVASIFMLYGAAVGVVGGILGSVTGAVFVHYINDLQDLLTRMNPKLQVWSPEVYAFSSIPNQVKLTDVVVIFVVAVLASTLGSVFAAIKAARIWPVEALRFE